MENEVQLTLGRICRAALKQSTALSYSADRLNRTPRPIYKTRRGEHVITARLLLKHYMVKVVYRGSAEFQRS